MQRRLRQYLRTARLSAGLSQSELGALLGVSADVISNVERGVSSATVKTVVGCSLLFGQTTAELFPSLYRTIEDDICARAVAFDRKLRGRTDPASCKKLALLAELVDRVIDAPAP